MRKARKAPVGKKRIAQEVVVIGAGVFGAWTAMHLLELGARVTLMDAWGPGHLRGTSCDESRVIRCGYGPRAFYSAWAWRALAQWKRFEKQAGQQLFVPSGVLWLCADENDYARASQAALKKLKVPVERLDTKTLSRRYPQFDYRGIGFAYHEPEAGYLRARAATMAVAGGVQRAGGRVLMGEVQAPSRSPSGQPCRHVRLTDGAVLEAEHFVFACGPWLPQMFPELLGRRILPTRQDVFYLGPPGGARQYLPPTMPVWLDPGPHFYGIPSGEGRGVKIADDLSGPRFDPTHGQRTVLPESVEAARAYLRLRLPALADAPIVETRVCQYERTPDSSVVVDRHPAHPNVWLVGGGSGHGYKLGPVLGEFVARHVLGKRAEPIPQAMRLGASAWPANIERPPTTSL
jgi:glycine/D-amino acid oxidase-like deaminating enzyme